MKKRELTDEEKRLWLEETGQLPKPVEKKKAASPPAKPPGKKTVPLAPVELGDLRGVDKKRAAARPKASLDLHGLTQEKAHIQVVRFVKQAAADGAKAILIITGKSGILRQSVPKWLDTAPLRPFILAISYATPREGGEGALRVLLRKRK